MSVESVMPSSHLILCRPLLLLPPIPPSIRVFSNESTLRMRGPKYWSFSFSIRGQGWRPRGATPHPRSGTVAERNYFTPGEVPRELPKALKVIPLHSLWENRDRWIVHPRKPVKCQLKVLPSSGLLSALKSLKQRTDFNM